MPVSILKTPEDSITFLRNSFLQEFDNQFIYDKCHYYNWCDNYLLKLDDETVGYSSIWGLNDRNERDTIFEFYLIPGHRKLADQFFKLLIEVPGVKKLECQSNDRLLSELIYRFGKDINAEAVLFEEFEDTELILNDIEFRKKNESDKSLKDDDGPDLLLYKGEIVAHGGLMFNYNFPYADIYMHVFEPHRQKGFGSLMVQELKKLAYQSGRVPAARCNINNFVSRQTLEKAGLRVCGFILIADIKTA